MTPSQIKVLLALHGITGSTFGKKVATYDIAQRAGMSVPATHSSLVALANRKGASYVRTHSIPNASVSGGAYKYGWELSPVGRHKAKEIHNSESNNSK